MVQDGKDIDKDYEIFKKDLEEERQISLKWKFPWPWPKDTANIIHIPHGMSPSIGQCLRLAKEKWPSENPEFFRIDIHIQNDTNRRRFFIVIELCN